MEFIDEISLVIKAGKGGDGCVSFRREYRNPKGGPDGGNGGHGGDIYFQGDEQINSFLNFSNKKNWFAEDGQRGQGSLKTGKSGQDLYIKVPLGTIIKQEKNKNVPEQVEEIISGELIFPKQTILLSKGGKGGLGNHALSSSINRTPYYARKGIFVEQIKLNLELRILADVGLIGLPNAGKTTLINALTNTNLREADYQFTTLYPQLAVLRDDEQRIVIADLPGIIEGASQNKGLGLRFLRHISRCPILVYILDTNQEKPENDFFTLQKELEKGNINISDKQKIIILNKIDLISFEKKAKIEEKIGKHFFIYISALKKTNLEKLKNKLFEIKNNVKISSSFPPSPIHQVYDFTYKADYEIIFLKSHYWKLIGSTIENVCKKYQQLDNAFLKELRKFSLEERLREKGIKNNDIIIIGEKEFLWKYS